MTEAAFEFIRGISVVKSYGFEGRALNNIRKAFKNRKNVSIWIEKSLHTNKLNAHTTFEIIYNYNYVCSIYGSSR